MFWFFITCHICDRCVVLVYWKIACACGCTNCAPVPFAQSKNRMCNVYIYEGIMCNVYIYECNMCNVYIYYECIYLCFSTMLWWHYVLNDLGSVFYEYKFFVFFFSSPSLISSFFNRHAPSPRIAPFHCLTSSSCHSSRSLHPEHWNDDLIHVLKRLLWKWWHANWMT